MVFGIPSAARLTEGWGRRKASVISPRQKGHCYYRSRSFAPLTPSLFLAAAAILAVACPCEAVQSQATREALGFSPSPSSNSDVGKPAATNTGERLLLDVNAPPTQAQPPGQQSLPLGLRPQLPGSQLQGLGLQTQLPGAEGEEPGKEKEKEEEELSRIERLISGEGTRDTNDASLKLRQYGYEVFQKSISTFAPVSDVPVGPDYLIGPGDAFTINVWGRVDTRVTVIVDRNGQIVLPEVGALRVWGMKFGALESYLRSEMSRKFSDFKLSVTMERLRTIQVFVIGEATAPGTYTISSLSTVINALCAAGGPSKNGSLRKVRLLRSGGDSNEVDLYAFLLAGDRRHDARLQDGDTIHIPLIGPVVAVAGDVKRPAIYEMAGPMSLQEALDLAGGATFAGWLQRVQVERVENHRRRIVADFNLSDQASQPEQSRALAMVVQDGDLIKVLSIDDRRENVVTLEGHVVRPGIYEWKPGMKLRDVLLSYDVMQPQPNLSEGEIVRLVPPDLHPTIVSFNLGRLMSGDQSENIELAQYDTIHVFKWDERHVETVRISGMVYEPNQYRLTADMRVRDLITRAGGLRKNAYLRKAEVTRSHVSQNGMTTEQINIDLALAMAGDPQQNILLQDYDYLVVRPIPELDFDQTVTINGEVRFPGMYPIRRDETISSLLERAGGYTDKAYLKGAVFTRESAKEVQRRRLNQLANEIEEAMLTGTEQKISGAVDADTVRGQQAALETKKELIAKLRATETDGRVVIKMAPLDELRGSRNDIKLEDKDVLAIPQTPGVVYVVGEVFNQTSLLYEDGATVNYYLRKVGGMTKDADSKQVSVVKADGSVISKQQGHIGQAVSWDKQSNQWVFGGFMTMPLDPGDTIVVPKKLDRFFWLQTTKDVTQVMMQVAITVGIAFAI
jgi:protein involved in polysaccharide export with SLBB domain